MYDNIYIFLCCKRIDGGGCAPPQVEGLRPSSLLPPREKIGYVYHVNTIDMKRHVIGSHFLFFLEEGTGKTGEEAPPPAGGRSPPAYTLTTQKNVHVVGKKNLFMKLFLFITFLRTMTG